MVGSLATDHMVVLMGSHGIITRGRHLEMAYWRVEYFEAMCDIYLKARQIIGSDDVPVISGKNAEIVAGWHLCGDH